MNTLRAEVTLRAAEHQRALTNTDRGSASHRRISNELHLLRAVEQRLTIHEQIIATVRNMTTDPDILRYLDAEAPQSAQDAR